MPAPDELLHRGDGAVLAAAAALRRQGEDEAPVGRPRRAPAAVGRVAVARDPDLVDVLVRGVAPRRAEDREVVRLVSAELYPELRDREEPPEAFAVFFSAHLTFPPFHAVRRRSPWRPRLR